MGSACSKMPKGDSTPPPKSKSTKGAKGPKKPNLKRSILMPDPPKLTKANPPKLTKVNPPELPRIDEQDEIIHVSPPESPTGAEVLPMPKWEQKVVVVRGTPDMVKGPAVAPMAKAQGLPLFSSDPFTRQHGLTKPLAPMMKRDADTIKNEFDDMDSDVKKFRSNRVPVPITFRNVGLTTFMLCMRCISRARYREAIRYADGSHYVAFIMCPACVHKNKEMSRIFAS